MVKNSDKRSFNEILDLIKDKKLGVSLNGEALKDEKEADGKEIFDGVEKTIKSNIAQLEIENEAFRNAYFNLLQEERFPVQEVSEEEFIRMIYLNQLPNKSKIFMAQVFNLNRIKNNITPLIRRAIDENNEEVILLVKGKVSVEDLFNRQFIEKIEGLYEKTVAILTERPVDPSFDDAPAKKVCNVQKTHQEMRNTVLLAEAFGFNPENVLKDANIANLYSFAINGVAYNRISMSKK